MRKYFKDRTDAVKARDERNARAGFDRYHIYKMPKGTRHHGEFAVCEYTEFLNTY